MACIHRVELAKLGHVRTIRQGCVRVCVCMCSCMSSHLLVDVYGCAFPILIFLVSALKQQAHGASKHTERCPPCITHAACTPARPLLPMHTEEGVKMMLVPPGHRDPVRGDLCMYAYMHTCMCVVGACFQVLTGSTSSAPQLQQGLACGTGRWDLMARAGMRTPPYKAYAESRQVERS